MADRKVTVVNPGGYQEQLPDSDNLLLAAAPTSNTHAVNKLYVDTGLANIDLSDIEADIDQLETDLGLLTTRVTNLEGQVNQEIVDRDAGDRSLQNQIDAIIAQGEIQNLDDVLKQGNSSTLGATFGGTVSANKFVGDGSDLTNLPIPPAPTLQSVTDSGDTTDNDMTSTGTITADVLVGDIDQGEY
tara:strand:- start:304 stop:864 length:561 start_codon:yes stop_codon:yes gene_type:complete